jgi:predicted metalloprotease
MRWGRGRRSRNVEDRRGMGMPSAGRMRLPGGLGLPRGGGMPRGSTLRRGGIGGIGLIVVMLIGLFFGIDPSVLFQGAVTTAPPPSSGPTARSPADDRLADFASAVLADTEDTWHPLFEASGGRYQEPVLVLFSGAVESACGFAQSAVGPFYCPGDAKLYLDLEFFQDLEARFGAPGDFAQAYVIAHEVGHHVQAQLGILQQVQAERAKLGEADANALSVALELQADCLAGIWAHHAHRARQILEQGDIEEGLRAAAAIGDDRMQRRAQGYVVPEAFTHGSSEQRVHWFREGLAKGQRSACDTFGSMGF